MSINELDITHVNIRSLNDEKMNAIRAELLLDYDIICLTETNLPAANVSDLNLDGFNPIIRKDRAGKTGGGVAIYAANHIGASRIFDYDIPDLEAMWVKIKAGNNILLICVCYRPPNSKAEFWTKLQDSVDLVKQSGVDRIMLVGDLNADPRTREGHLLNIFSISNNFTLHVKEPTRITPTTATILDQFITNIPNMLKKVEVLDPISTCDHCPIRSTIVMKHKFNKPKAYTRHIWLYNLADFDNFKTELQRADWDACFSYDDIDAICDAWTSTFFNIARTCIPNKVVTVRPGDKLFYTAELRRLRRKKNKIHRQAKLLNTAKSWTDFREIRNHYNFKIREAKTKSQEKNAETLRDPIKVSPKKWWKLAKSFIKEDSTRNSCYPALNVNNNMINDDKEKADEFNNFFLKHSNIDDTNVPIPDGTPLTDKRLYAVKVTELDVTDLLKNLDIGKATGPDRISHLMLKKAGAAIVPSLTKLFNLSLSKSIFPTSWKKAHVTPIFKKNDKSVVDNYRPISLLSCVSKLFERAVFKYLFNFLRDTNAISIKQSGFVPGDSTVYQLAHLYHIFSEALDKQKDIRVVFCDISKAFDRVWHTGLLAKLSRVGITGQLLDWLSSYLNKRQQRVVINGQTSLWGLLKAGVPQGSVLGPLLFLIYINDITFEAQSAEIRLFADDTILYLFVDNPVESAQALNDDLERINNWASQWLVKFSPSKTKTMTLSKKKKPIVAPPLIMNGTVLNNVASHKHLGVTFSKNLSWQEHIEDLATNAGRCLDILNALKYKLDRATLEKLYFAFVRSKLEYANIVWDNCSKQLSDLLESVQYRAAKIISGAIHRTSHDIVYRELGWEYLEERRRKQRLKVMYKTIHGETPVFLQNSLPMPVGEHNRYALRNEHNFPQLRTRTSTFQNSFIPKTIQDWNNLDNDIKGSNTLETFTRKLNTPPLEVPKWFYLGERSMSINHAKLRMLCSPINDHLYSHIHVIESPTCICGHNRENNKHFLLECPLFINERNEMFNNLMQLGFQPTVNNLLFGNAQYSVNCNIQAFVIIQKYIAETGRF